METDKIRCKYCQHLRCTGRMQAQRGYYGRKTYYCEHPETKKYPLDTFGTRAPGFVGFGLHMVQESPLTLKTAPRWCPRVAWQKEKAKWKEEHHDG